ncbi:phytoene dehydrogenase [Pontibacillus halophilus JSM 076056 = DSM 19796]|uniref:Phytoene dehydrogenase n=1 Tax=Pontibacillus halophilus JSM 076056 = DSM 19796 TaxID=1385510 RepID=A0A0A5GRL5_9BACI|nr:NAD(P)/FAD-dependent oxidoreductase [Pontibacillus halophilus]KGX93810.1 phytoene dehydrogenase [Pontibacillus halophilus JSM 076056 = DSM 19796]
MEHYDTLIVGAGFGGLSAGAVLAKAGYKVGVLEASNELGGSAGKFDRFGYRFQAGATVGMGFEEGGVLQQLFQHLELTPPPMRRMDTIMNIYLPDETIHYYRDAHKWFTEAGRVFPTKQAQVQRFFHEVFSVGRKLDSILTDLPVFPPSRPRDWANLLKYVNYRNVTLLPYFTSTVADRLKKYHLDRDERFMTFLNGQLMDSVQTTADQCPAFLGYAALQTFHKGAYAVEGGLASIAEKLGAFIEEQGGAVHKRRPALTIERQGSGFRIKSRRERTYEAERIILNHSLHNFHSTVSPELAKASNIPKETGQENTWGAFMMYFGVKDEFRDDVLYHQIVQDQNLPLSEGNQFLLSFSAKDDLTMAPIGKRSVTVSTHTKADPWWNQEHYEERKSHYEEVVMNGIQKHFPQFTELIDVRMPGTPVTFERFTSRHKGQVGGYAPTGKWSWLNSQSVYTGIPKMYVCGDTVFPGAGTLGTSLSGWLAAEELMKS